MPARATFPCLLFHPFCILCAGEGYTSEGAELLGDCVLDYLAATFFFHALPHEHEGVLTECKVRGQGAFLSCLLNQSVHSLAVT